MERHQATRTRLKRPNNPDQASRDSILKLLQNTSQMKHADRTIFTAPMLLLLQTRSTTLKTDPIFRSSASQLSNQLVLDCNKIGSEA